MRFRKVPVEIDAWPVRELVAHAKSQWSKLPKCVSDAHEHGKLSIWNDNIHIATPEGVMKASEDDWLIRGVKGELYPCKPEIFALTYERVEHITDMNSTPMAFSRMHDDKPVDDSPMAFSNLRD